jgi:hypothetical protein
MGLGAPKVTQPALEQPAQAPTDVTTGTQSTDALRRRMGLASTVLTGPGGASTATASITGGKSTLGS